MYFSLLVFLFIDSCWLANKSPALTDEVEKYCFEIFCSLSCTPFTWTKLSSEDRWYVFGLCGRYQCWCINVCIITVSILLRMCGASVADVTVVSQLQRNTANVILLTQPLKIHWIFKDAFDSIHRRWVESGVGYSSLFLFLHNYLGKSTFSLKMRTWEAYVFFPPLPNSRGTSYSWSISSNA